MRAYAGDQQGWPGFEFEELAQSFEEPSECFRDLFLGFPGEPYQVREARLAAARDVFVELDEAARHGEIDRVNAAYAAALRDVAPLWDRRSLRPRTPLDKGAA